MIKSNHYLDVALKMFQRMCERMCVCVSCNAKEATKTNKIFVNLVCCWIRFIIKIFDLFFYSVCERNYIATHLGNRLKKKMKKKKTRDEAIEKPKNMLKQRLICTEKNGGIDKIDDMNAKKAFENWATY